MSEPYLTRPQLPNQNPNYQTDPSSTSSTVASSSTQTQPAQPGQSTTTPAAVYQGVPQTNKFAPGAAASSSQLDPQAVASQIGAPYISASTLAKTDAQTQGNPVRQQVTDYLRNYTPGDPKGPEVAQAVVSAFAGTHLNPAAIVLLATLNAIEQKQKDLSYLHNKANRYEVINKAFSEYAGYLQQKQSELDSKTAGKSGDDAKKQEVVLEKQLSFDPSTFDTLDKDGGYTPKNLAAGKSDNDNRVKSDGLANRLTTYSSQHDPLQRLIDTNNTDIQNGLQNLNNLLEQASKLILNVRDTSVSIARNI